MENLDDQYLVGLNSAAKPRTFNFLNLLDLSKDVVRRLSLHLNNLEHGSDSVFLSPLGKAIDPERVLKLVDNIFSGSSDSINDTLSKLEMSNRSKFGPRSIAKPWSDRLPNVKDYFEDQSDDQNKDLKIPALDVNHTLRPIGLSSAIKRLKNNTNSGLPDYVRKSKVKDTLLEDFPSLLRREDPCILFTRTQEGGKTRNVWGYPAADTLNEMRFYVPLLEYQRRLSWRSALNGPDAVDRALTAMMIKGRSLSLLFVSVDFARFDASVKKYLQNKCFSRFKMMFQNNYDDEITYLAHRFNTIGLVTPSGLFTGNHGVPSGATFTNEVDSVAQHTIAEDSGFNTDTFVQIQGDDGAYAIDPSRREALFNSFLKAGLVINEEKSHTSYDSVIYLQRLYDFKYMNKSSGLIGGIYPIYRALNRIIYQERFTDFMDVDLSGKDYYSIRTISILENCKYHPLFKEFVRVIYDLDKYSLAYSKDSVAKYIRYVATSPGSYGTIKNQFSDDISGINSFETVKLISSFA